MKSANNFARTIAATVLCLALFASASFAKNNPLNIPRGMAVDSQGNLWVANAGTNSILAFSPTYKQLTSDTITAGVSEPTDVAFDSLGNLWVCNYDISAVTEYTGGVQNTSATLTGVPLPTAIAVDGLNNVWVANSVTGNGFMEVYSPNQVYGPSDHLQMAFGPYPSIFYGLTVSGGALAWGNGSSLTLVPATVALTTGALDGVGVGGNNTATYLASAANGTIYFATTDNAINFAQPADLGSASPLIELSFAPTGIAVDSVRGRIYISNGYGNSISVYSTGGTLLKTIE
jgi:DNA-binding beta-propeller fold protein YncE